MRKKNLFDEREEIGWRWKRELKKLSEGIEKIV
jgi:hypothetical protein